MVTADEWFEQIHKLIADPHWTSISLILGDLRSVTDMSSIEEAEIEQAVDIFSTVPSPLSNKRVAIIANEAFWKSTSFGKLISRFGPSVIVFNELGIACLYLGINTTEALKAIQQLRLRLQTGAA